jgi:chaperonin cofactor prefoldin
LVEQSYHERIDELQDQNERKDLRIKLLEQKLQRLQVCIIIIQMNKAEKKLYNLFLENITQS